MKKDIQILWAAMNYHLRRFANLFKEQEFVCDDRGNYYYVGDSTSMQRVLYRRAYQSWQVKRYNRNQCNIGTDLFEADTNISDGIKRTNK